MKELRTSVATKIAKYAVPDEILVSGLASGWTALFIYTFFSSSHNEHHNNTDAS